MPDSCRICGVAETICEHLGVVRFDVPESDPRWGKLHRCPNYPVEQDTDRQIRLRQLSNLGALSDKTFENFQTGSELHTPAERESIRKAYEAAWMFARQPEGWLLLIGPYGSGKTHLAAAVGNWRLEQGAPVLFITSPDLLDHLRTSFNENAEETYDEMFERIKSSELLILDDLGVENPSGWAKEKLFQLFNHRYTHHLPTVVTTNADVDKLDPRISSRLMDQGRTTRMELDVRDYRLFGEMDKATTLSSNLHLYRDLTFKTFDLHAGLNGEEQANLENVAHAAARFAQNPDGRWLVLAGAPGTGKTHLAAAIANHRQQSGDDVFFISAPDLLDELRTTFSSSAGATFEQRFEKVKHVGLLVLDDLGGGQTEWAREKLFQLIDYRYVTRKPTVFTLSDFDRLSERLKVRLLDERVCMRYEITAAPYVMRLRRR